MLSASAARTVARVGANGIGGREPADVEVRRVAPLPPPHRRLDVDKAVLRKSHQTQPMRKRIHARALVLQRTASMNASISAFVAAPTWLHRHGVARPRTLATVPAPPPMRVLPGYPSTGRD